MSRKQESNDDSPLKAENQMISGPDSPGSPQIRAAAFGTAMDEIENPEEDITDKPGVKNAGTR